MTVTDAPQVSQVAPEQTDLVIDKLNAWRDEMPAIDPNALMDRKPRPSRSRLTAGSSAGT